MTNKNRIDLAEKYTDSVIWISRFTINNPLGYNKFLDDVRSHTIKMTGCTSEKYDELKKSGINEFFFEPEYQPIVECFWQYVDNIRKARL